MPPPVPIKKPLAAKAAPKIAKPLPPGAKVVPVLSEKVPTLMPKKLPNATTTPISKLSAGKTHISSSTKTSEQPPRVLVPDVKPPARSDGEAKAAPPGAVGKVPGSKPADAQIKHTASPVDVVRISDFEANRAAMGGPSQSKIPEIKISATGEGGASGSLRSDALRNLQTLTQGFKAFVAGKPSLTEREQEELRRASRHLSTAAVQKYRYTESFIRMHEALEVLKRMAL